jgi:hypothetical protein
MWIACLITLSWAAFFFVFGLAVLAAGREIDVPWAARSISDMAAASGSFVFFGLLAAFFGIMVLKGLSAIGGALDPRLKIR